MCQQSVEKCLKALIVVKNENPMPVHNLPTLAKDAGIWDMLPPEQRTFLRALTAYAIEARYPERKQKLYQQCTRAEAERLLDQTREMIIWLEGLIKERLFRETW